MIKYIDNLNKLMAILLKLNYQEINKKRKLINIIDYSYNSNYHLFRLYYYSTILICLIFHSILSN